MTRREAIQAMKKGFKVTHDYFSSNEYITMIDDKIVTEEGYKFNTTEFWSYRTDEHWDTDWSYYKH